MSRARRIVVLAFLGVMFAALNVPAMTALTNSDSASKMEISLDDISPHVAEETFDGGALGGCEFWCFVSFERWETASARILIRVPLIAGANMSLELDARVYAASDPVSAEAGAWTSLETIVTRPDTESVEAIAINSTSWERASLQQQSFTAATDDVLVIEIVAQQGFSNAPATEAVPAAMPSSATRGGWLTVLIDLRQGVPWDAMDPNESSSLAGDGFAATNITLRVPPQTQGFNDTNVLRLRAAVPPETILLDAGGADRESWIIQESPRTAVLGYSAGSWAPGDELHFATMTPVGGPWTPSVSFSVVFVVVVVASGAAWTTDASLAAGSSGRRRWLPVSAAVFAVAWLVLGVVWSVTIGMDRWPWARSSYLYALGAFALAGWAFWAGARKRHRSGPTD